MAKSLLFQSYSDATKYAKGQAGTIVKRNPEGNGWLVLISGNEKSSSKVKKRIVDHNFDNGSAEPIANGWHKSEKGNFWKKTSKGIFLGY